MKNNDTIKYFLYGIIMGISNVIPGVSGGTMAVILRIYDKALLAFTRQNIKKNLPFLIPLGIGSLLGIYTFSKLISNLLYEHQTLLTFAFTGIILGSIPAIFKRAQYEKAKAKNILLGIVALTFMVLLSYLSNSTLGNISFFTWEAGNPLFYIWLMVSSTFAMIAMLLPGISGSLILLILGAYPIAMEAIAYFQWDILSMLALGVLLGGYLGVKGIQNMLNNHPQALYFIILGLVIGSLFFLFSNMREGFLSPINYILLLFFIITSFIFSRK